LAAISRFREIRPTMLVVVARESAKALLDANRPILEQNAAKYYQLFGLSERWTSRSIPVLLHNFVAGTKAYEKMPIAQLAGVAKPKKLPVAVAGEPAGSFKPPGEAQAGDLARQGGGKVEFIGTALFDGDRMVGELNGDETLFLSILRGELGRFTYAFKDPLNKKYIITLRIRQHHPPRIAVRLPEGRAAITVHGDLQAEILAIQSGINYETPRMTKKLEEYLNREFSRRANKLVAKAQTMGVDVFGFGKAARIHFLTEPAWENYRWLAKFPHVPVKVAIEVEVRRTDLLMLNYPIIERTKKKLGVSHHVD
jgi:spore germination protein KC